MNKQDKIKNHGLITPHVFRAAIDRLSDSDAGVLYKSLMAYKWDGTIPDVSLGILYGVFLAMQPSIDEHTKTFIETCEMKQQIALDRHAKERANRKS